MKTRSHNILLPKRSEGRAFSDKRGHSLVEMMMGTAILTVVLAGTFNGLGQAILMQDKVNAYNYATQLLQAEMDELQAKTWSDISSLPAQYTYRSTDYLVDVPLNNRALQRTITSRGASQKEIRLTLEWVDIRGNPHTREYVTTYTENGLFDYSYRAL